MPVAHRKSASFHRLKWLSVVGGFLDGARLEFAPSLNCIIGGRGTGKTTALEFIRYALDAMPEEPQARKRVEALVSRNLDFGHIELGIETKDGLSYIVSRALGEAPIVMTDDRKPTDIALKAGGFFQADIFSQNEVESIADESLSQLGLIDNFEAERIAEIEGQLRQVTAELAANSGAVTPLQDGIAGLREDLKTLPNVEQTLKGLAATVGSDASVINQAHAKKALRDREKRALDATLRFLTEYQQTLTELAGRVERETRMQFHREVLAGPNKDLLADAMQGLLACGQDVDAALKKAQESVRQALARLPGQTAKLTAVHAEQEMAFRALIEKHQAAMGQATERAKLERARNELDAKQHELADAEARLKKLDADRRGLLRRLTDLRRSRFQVRKEVVDRINTVLSPTIRVSLVQDGNPARYRELVEEALRGSKMKYAAVADKIAEAMWPADLAGLVRARNAQGLAEKAGVNQDQAEKAMVALNASGRLHDLEVVELVDLPTIELNDGGKYKGSQELSTGQKCTTILPILLMESAKPLLIDQPEDNLDNRFISETVVRNLRSVKIHRQLIFVTHNPNIPVLGDSEQVFVMESNGTSAKVVKSGTVDGCRDEVVTLLEGGAEAFRQRWERYKH